MSIRSKSIEGRLRGLRYTRRASLHETPRTLKNLVDTWLRQALERLPESVVPPSGRDVRIEVQRPKDPRRGDFARALMKRVGAFREITRSWFQMLCCAMHGLRLHRPCRS
jgi:hypothetical protein